MKDLVDDVLDDRRGRENRRHRIFAGGVAVVGHTLLAAVIALAPAFAARRQNQVREYMRVMIVPAKALGDAMAPAETAPPKPKPPAPKPVMVAEKKPAKVAPVMTQSEADRQADSRSTAAADAAPSGEAETESTRRRGGPDGTAFGTTPFGSSEASFDDPNFMYGYYVQQMLALIGSHWVRPRANPGTEMAIHYNIDRNGRLTDIEVVEESGNRSFDLAGFRAVTLASPLPPLPQSYRLDSLGVTLVIK